jgi:hypothetical protein
VSMACSEQKVGGGCGGGGGGGWGMRICWARWCVFFDCPYWPH